MLESRIIRNKHIFLLEVDGKQMPLYGYMSYQPSRADYEAFRASGVHLFFTGAYAGDRGINQHNGLRPFRPGFWKGYGEYDFSAVDEDFRRITKGGREGEDFIIPRLMIEPPAWWDEDNPTELCRDVQGTPVHHSFHSEKWFADARRVLADFQKWLTESGWDRFVVGWHLASGGNGEFFRPFQHPFQYTDYSEPARRAFRQWAREKYADIDVLNRAWHMNLPDFDAVQIPNPAYRMFGSDGIFKNPELERYTIDYYRFQNEGHAKALIDLCTIAKEVTDYKQIIGAFFCYGTREFGQEAVRTVLRSDKIDFLASPLDYIDNRAMGIDWRFAGSVESAALHGKPWFVEADVRTCLSVPISQCMPDANPYVSKIYDRPVWYGPEDVEGSLSQMKKVFAKVLTHNTAIWWFDMWGGWYRNPKFMEFHRQAADLYRNHALSGGSENAAPIVVFRDKELSFELGAYGPRDYEILLGSAGTPYRIYEMEDFEEIDPKRYRLAIFSCIRHWTEEQKAALERWKNGGRVLAFTGPVDLSGITGIEVEENARFEPLPGEVGRYEKPLMVRTIRLCDIPGDVVFTYAPDGRAVELLRRQPDYSVYVTTSTDITDDRLEQMIVASGAQLYTYSRDTAYVSDRYVAIHARNEGIKRVAVPMKAVLRDVFTGETAPGNETYVDLDMKFGETRILRIEPMK